VTTEVSDWKERIKRDIRGARDFGKLVQALAVAKGHLGNAVQSSSRWRDAPRVTLALKAMLESPGSVDDWITKATVQPGTSTDTVWAGPLVPVLTLASEFVTYMRPLHLIGRIPGLRKVPFNVKFARITSGASGGFAAQNVPIPTQALTLDTITLSYARVNAISVITEELARSQSYDAPGLISADLAAAAASFMDEAFIDPDRAGVVGTSPASITFGAAQIPSSGLTPAQLVADAKSAMKILDQSRVPLSQCCWIMTQDVALYLSTLLATTGQPVFEDFSLADGGTWFGLPTYVSGSAFGANSPTEGLIVLLHPDSVALADDDVATISVSGETSLAMDSAPSSPATLTSLWQNNLIGCKISRYCNWQLRRTGAVATIRGINL
jgi:hypothetical protein